MRGARGVILFLSLTTLAIGCKVKRSPLHGLEKQTTLSEKEQLDFSFLFHEAIKDKLLGNYSQAQNKLQQAIRINPRSDAAHFELSRVYLQNGNADLARMSAELAVKFNPENIWYKRTLVGIYDQTGEWARQIALLQEMSKHDPADTEILYDLGEAYIHAGKYEEALKIYDKIEKKTGLSEELAIQKKNLYLQLRKPDKAIDEISKLIQNYPEELGYRGVLAEIYLYNKQPEKALGQYQEILRLDPQNPNVYFSLADFYRKQGDNQKSFEALRQAFVNPESSADLKIQVVASYFEITSDFPELKDQAYQLCQELIRAHPEDTRAKSIYGDFLFRDEKYREALEQYEGVLKTDKSRFSVWNQLLLTLNELGETETLNQRSTEAAELFPQQAVIYLYKGLSSMQMKQYETAVESLKEGLLVAVDNKPLTVQFLASLGDSYHHLGRYPESDEAYEQALKADPANTYVLNNYAYYLSVRKSKLDRAAELALKCNTIVPGKPSYQDTYAWVLFQAGKLEEAALWIDKAISSGGGTNSTIVEHRGDIYWSLDKRQEAIESWQKALEIGGEPQRLNQKIREGLPQHK
jgi:tetratricopeptide (TPR) repeat protein